MAEKRDLTVQVTCGPGRRDNSLVLGGDDLTRGLRGFKLSCDAHEYDGRPQLILYPNVVVGTVDAAAPVVTAEMTREAQAALVAAGWSPPLPEGWPNLTDEQRRLVWGEDALWSPLRELHARLVDRECRCTDDDPCREHELIAAIETELAQRDEEADRG